MADTVPVPRCRTGAAATLARRAGVRAAGHRAGETRVSAECHLAGFYCIVRISLKPHFLKKKKKIGSVVHRFDACSGGEN